MIRIVNISEVHRGEQDHAYAIVRSMKHPSEWLEQLAVLSPSKELFWRYLDLSKHGLWNQSSFQQIYVPTFLREMLEPEPRAELAQLFELDQQGETIALCCFCKDETLCHRSIVAGLLQGAGCNVVLPTGKDYSAYWEQYQKLS